MPLIMMSGFPSSGKSTRAKELLAWLENKIKDYKGTKLSVELIGDSSLGVTRDSYKDTNQEKKNRGTIISAVERKLSKEKILIVDSLNYIKGFRYQLFCVARSIGTPHCVVYTACPISTATENNNRNIAEGKEQTGGCYSAETFEELVSRYEEPSGTTKWDSPLYLVLPGEELPYEKIWESIVLKKAAPPNLATAVSSVSETNFLYQLDMITKQIVDHIYEEQRKSGGMISKTSVPGSLIKFEYPTNSRQLNIMELRKLRKQFISINKNSKGSNVITVESIPNLFVEYLQTNFS